MTIIIHVFRCGFLSVVLERIWRCSSKGTLVRTRFPSSGALEFRSLEYTQISACVWAPSRPMMCFPTSQLKKIHEVPKGEAAVSLQTLIIYVCHNPWQGCLSLRWPVMEVGSQRPCPWYVPRVHTEYQPQFLSRPIPYGWTLFAVRNFMLQGVRLPASTAVMRVRQINSD